MSANQKYEVSLTRDAVAIVRYHVSACNADAAEDIVQFAIDSGKLGTLGEPVSTEYQDDEDKLFYVVDSELVP